MNISTPLDSIIENRKEKLQKLRQAGVNPYPARCEVTATAAEVAARFTALQTGETSTEIVSVAGRLVSRREMGKATFADIIDSSGKLQFYIKADFVGVDSFKQFKELVDLSDFISIKGTPFRTRSGELSIKVDSWTMLTKALRPLPEKWHGLKDTETRYRQRYLDLIANPEVKDVFVKRSKVIATIRRELEKRGFLEVETPLMQSIPGGAAARPFVTHMNALDIDLYLRIAPELYLKRLVVGGLDRVYEIGRNFRNEGIDRTHNPEFTMLELYQAYGDYNEMMNLSEQLILAAATALGVEIQTPFKRERMFDLLKRYTGKDLQPLLGTGGFAQAAKELNVEIPKNTPEKKILDHIFDKMVLPHLTEPTFVIDYPSEYSPLAKQSHEQPAIAERFELFVKGKEIANAYSELNDPEVQRRNFQEQMEDRLKGDDEAQPYDEDFVVALEHGLPPTGGLGIGIDRLIMTLADIDSIREVILFPLMRPEQENAGQEETAGTTDSPEAGKTAPSVQPQE